MRPSSFKCFACKLKVTGFSKLNACGLGDTFTAKSLYEPADYFQLIDPSFLDEDNNE
jgi:hypothetical protein